MKIILSFLLILSSCSKKHEDKDIVLTTKSIFGSTVLIATFNGNSGYKLNDCNNIATVLNSQINGQHYICEHYEDIKKQIK